MCIKCIFYPIIFRQLYSNKIQRLVIIKNMSPQKKLSESAKYAFPSFLKESAKNLRFNSKNPKQCKRQQFKESFQTSDSSLRVFNEISDIQKGKIFSCSGQKYQKKLIWQKENKMNQLNKKKNIYFGPQSRKNNSPTDNLFRTQNTSGRKVQKQKRFRNFTGNPQSKQDFCSKSKKIISWDKLTNDEVLKFRSNGKQSKKSFDLFKSKPKNIEHKINLQPQKKVITNLKISSGLSLLKEAFQYQIAPQNSTHQLNEYIFLKKLGRGSSSDVFLVRHIPTGFILALKVIDKKYIDQMNLKSIISREIENYEIIQKHPNIVDLYKKFEDKKRIYMVMEYMSVGNLYSIWKKVGNIGEDIVKRIIKDVCTALVKLHQKEIIHRDVKLQNVLLSYNVAKLSDLGCSICSANMRKSCIGSPQYMSPEQLNKSYYDKKIDLWSLGIMTFELLFGYSPFGKDIERILINKENLQIQQVNFPSHPQIQVTTKDFITKLLQKNKNLRMSAKEALNHQFLNFS